MLGSETAGDVVHKIYSDGGAVIPTRDPEGIWTIICPHCNTKHRAASRLCPSCTKTEIHELIRRQGRLEEQNEKLRELVHTLRQQLFVLWHTQAIAEGAKNPQLAVEKKWSAFLREAGI